MAACGESARSSAWVSGRKRTLAACEVVTVGVDDNVLPILWAVVNRLLTDVVGGELSLALPQQAGFCCAGPDRGLFRWGAVARSALRPPPPFARMYPLRPRPGPHDRSCPRWLSKARFHHGSQRHGCLLPLTNSTASICNSAVPVSRLQLVPARRALAHARVPSTVPRRAEALLDRPAERRPEVREDQAGAVDRAEGVERVPGLGS